MPKLPPGIGMVPTSRINILPGHNNRPAVMDPVLGGSLASNLGRVLFEKHLFWLLIMKLALRNAEFGS